MKNFHAEKCDPTSAKKAKDILGDVTVAQAQCVSKASAQLVTWVCINTSWLAGLNFTGPVCYPLYQYRIL
jgi:hypothetical protein